MEYNISDFRPTFDNVIVEPIKVTELKGGIVRPQGDDDKAQLGKVIRVGPQVDAMGIKVGDVVLMSPYSTNNQDLGKELVLRAEDIWAIWNAPANESNKG